MTDHPTGRQLGQTHKTATQDVCRNQSKNFNFLIGYDNVHMELIYRHSDVASIRYECHFAEQFVLLHKIKAEGKVSVPEHSFVKLSGREGKVPRIRL
jgi:hypothetical protein